MRWQDIFSHCAASFSGGFCIKHKDVPEDYVYTRPKKNTALLTTTSKGLNRECHLSCGPEG